MNSQRSSREIAYDSVYLCHFLDEISVECPKCGNHALILGEGRSKVGEKQPKVVCRHCGYNEERSATSWKGPVQGIAARRCAWCGRHLEKRVSGHRYLPYTRLKCDACGLEMDEPVNWYPDIYGKPHDPYFGLPLWFTGTVRGQVLWAYNREHLNFIKHLVEAKIRKRSPTPNQALANRLPKWILDKKNRAHVLDAISKIEKTA